MILNYRCGLPQPITNGLIFSNSHFNIIDITLDNDNIDNKYAKKIVNCLGVENSRLEDTNVQWRNGIFLSIYLFNWFFGGIFEKIKCIRLYAALRMWLPLET